MEKQLHAPDSTGNYETALSNAAKGIVSIPCYPNTKVPRVKWKRWQSEMPPDELLRKWFLGTKNNIAILCDGLVLFDCDDPAKARQVLSECGDTPYKVRSPSGGVHLGFRRRKGLNLNNQVKIKGMDIDIRTDGGLAMIPPSRTENGAYEWLGEGLPPISDLPLARIAWTRARKREMTKCLVNTFKDSSADSLDPGRILYRGKLYVDTFERRAVSGCNGHTSLFVAALKIVKFVRMLGGGESEAWQLLLYFNATKCDPPWDLSRTEDERALQHKLKDALRLAR